MRGTVVAVSVSVRMVQLGPAANGFSNVAVTTDTEMVRANGAPLTLGDVTAGAKIEVVGRPRDAMTIVARKVTLL